MYSGLVHAHSGLRWVALLLLVAAVVTAIGKWQGRSGYTDGNRKLYLFTLISVHTQLVLGLILLFISPKVNFSMISEKLYRFYSVEHTAGMLIAILLITIGYSRSKRAADVTTKQRLIGIFYGLGLLLIPGFHSLAVPHHRGRLVLNRPMELLSGKPQLTVPVEDVMN